MTYPRACSISSWATNASNRAFARSSVIGLRSWGTSFLSCCVLRRRIDRHHHDLALAPYPLFPQVGHVDGVRAEEEVVGVDAPPFVAAMAEEGDLGHRPVHRGPRPAVGQPG